jgi:hypothetical protein
MKANTAGLFSLSHIAPSPPTGDQPPPDPTDPQGDRSPRVRTTTLDRFNQEMSVLDQPLEGEVEYYDEPQPRRWRVRAIGVAIFALSFGGYLTAARYRHAPQVAAREPSAPSPATEVVAAVPAPPSAPALAMAAPAAPAPAPATEKPEAATADEPAAPPKAVALQAKADRHHHHHSRHASGRHHHGGHAHHAA